LRAKGAFEGTAAEGGPVAAGPLAGQVALVTGGSRGIGAAISGTLAAAGATVAINYVRDSETAERLAADLTPTPSLWRADVADRTQVDAMIAGILETHARLDVLVINAGVWRGGKVRDLSAEDWRTVIETSLTGAYHLAAAASPVLTPDNGRIIVMSSVIGIVGFPGDSAYASAKAGLFGLVRSLAKELGSDGMTVNAVAPGFIDTDMTRAVSGESRERMIRRTALRRAGHVDEVAAAVRYLACDATYVTGHTLVVDGGFSL
jgi:3-oxoacyl-[acyl-carrier protein] reductase